MRKYTTIQGDMWDGIAVKIYGDESYLNVLLEANQEYRNIIIFPANIGLVVPDITLTQSSKVPPWKRRKL